MPGALVGVASCARCGKLQTAAGALCQLCGTVLTPAARGSVLGTYTPLLAGVARASAVRGYLAVLIDVFPLAAAAGIAVVTAAAGDFRTVTLIVLSSIVFVGAQASLFVRRAALWVVSRGPSDSGRPDGQPSGFSQDHGPFDHFASDSSDSDCRFGTGPRPVDFRVTAAARICTRRRHG